jgi:hypothetical protein
MNERIRELADKIWAEEYWDNPNTDKLLPAQLNKFAELLEKEFFSQGYIAGKSDGTIETVRECADFLADTLDDHFASEQLREQFGVEE